MSSLRKHSARTITPDRSDAHCLLVDALKGRLAPNPDPLTPAQRIAYIEAHLMAIKAHLCLESSESTGCTGPTFRGVREKRDVQHTQPGSSGRGDCRLPGLGVWRSLSRTHREFLDRLQSLPSRTNVSLLSPLGLGVAVFSLSAGVLILRRGLFSQREEAAADV